jgi:hypothetical protein
VDDAVIQIKRTETRPVARGSKYVGRSHGSAAWSRIVLSQTMLLPFLCGAPCDLSNTGARLPKRSVAQCWMGNHHGGWVTTHGRALAISRAAGGITS